jgi:hypothetical protein
MGVINRVQIGEDEHGRFPANLGIGYLGPGHAGINGGIVAGSFSVIADFSRKRFMDENHCL